MDTERMAEEVLDHIPIDRDGDRQLIINILLSRGCETDEQNDRLIELYEEFIGYGYD